MDYSKFYFIFKSSRIRSLIFNYIANREGGLAFSQTARDIFERCHNIKIGYGSYGCFDYVNLRPNIKIGNYCSFAPGVKIFRANHPYNLFTTHPITYGVYGGNVKLVELDYKSLQIGNDVWIGANSIILPSVNYIGNGSVIGAGSVVTKNVEPYSIVGGNPAKIIKMRFGPKTIEKLEKIRWWDFNKEELQDRMIFLQGIIQENES